MTDKETTFGVIIELSQREPLMVKVNPPREKYYRFNLFGHFDEMLVEIVDDLGESFNKRYKELKKHSAQDRICHHPETKKLYLYAKDKDRGVLENLLREGAADKPLIALIAIKLRHQFFDRPLHCDPCKCIDFFLEKHISEKKAKATFFTMRALNIYDVYVLIRTDDPNFILHCAHYLQYHTCEFERHNKEDGTTYITAEKIIEIASKSAEKLSDELVNEKPTDYFSTHHASVTSAIKTINDDCATSRENVKKGNEILFPYKNDIIDNLTKDLHDYRLAAKSSKHNEVLLNYINIIRACGIMPLILQTYTIIGCKEGMQPKEDKRTKNVLFELQMQLHPGSGIEKFKEELESKGFISDLDKKLNTVLGRYYLVSKEFC